MPVRYAHVTPEHVTTKCPLNPYYIYSPYYNILALEYNYIQIKITLNNINNIIILLISYYTFANRIVIYQEE